MKFLFILTGFWGIGTKTVFLKSKCYRNPCRMKTEFMVQFSYKNRISARWIFTSFSRSLLIFSSILMYFTSLIIYLNSQHSIVVRCRPGWAYASSVSGTFRPDCVNLSGVCFRLEVCVHSPDAHSHHGVRLWHTSHTPLV